MFDTEYKRYRHGTNIRALELPPDLPADLRDLVTARCGDSHAEGFFMFVAHADVAPALAIWDVAAKGAFAFLKCAFGHLIVYQQGQYRILDPVFNVVDEATDSLAFVLDVLLCDRPAMEASLFIDVYEQAYPRLGAPDVGEMYAFYPALGLGGARDPAHVRKVGLAQELRILRAV